jgi:hypothetical protein
MTQPLHEVLSQDDLNRLVEDSGLSAQEIAAQYEMAVKKAKSESNPKKAVNRFQRRRQQQQMKRILNSQNLGEANRSIEEKSEEERKDIYMRILERVLAENDKFAKMKEKQLNETTD